MVDTKYRWDFIGLSTDTKPTPADSDKVVDGSTFYCSDTSKLYVYCKDDWYEKKPLGGGGGGGTSYTAGSGIDITNNTISVDTQTIQPKLTAGSNVTISDNTISATDTTYSAFTGTDGQTAGASGLVPAPATTDVDKFLKSDGTWTTAGGGGGITELSSADYDYPTDNPTSIAIWNLEPGVYRTVGGTNLKMNTTDYDWEESGPCTIIVNNSGSNTWTEAVLYSYNFTLGSNVGRFVITGPNGQKSRNENATAPAIMQTIGSEQDKVMSQDATTKMIYADGATAYKIAIGNNSSASGARGVAIGQGASAGGQYSIALGAGAECIRNGGVSFGGSVTYNGQMNIGAVGSYGYNNTSFRLLSGLYDGQNAHDAVTVSQINTLIDAINSALSVSIPHIGASN